MRMLLVCTVATLLVVPAWAQNGNRAGGGAVSRAAPPSTLRLLNQRIPEITFDAAPLEQVMSWVQDLTQMNVNVRWQMLEDAGIRREKPISIQAKNLRLSQVLWMIMTEAGGSEVKIAYRASGNLLVVSTEDDLGKEMVVRVYDVADLLVRIPNFRNAPRIDFQQATQNTGGGGSGGGSGGGGFGGGGGGSGLFGGGQGGGSNQEDDDQQGRGGGNGEDPSAAEAERLVGLITNTVEPDTWAQNGGTGTIQAYRRMLVVRNNILVHQRLAGFVEELD